MLNDLVFYNRSNRVYEVTDPATGKVAEFPAGSAGRQSAFKAGVYAQSPRLYRLATAMIRVSPVLESRIWRACELVISGAVRLVSDPGPECGQAGSAVALVGSSNEFGDYVVRRAGGQWVCDCEDYTGGMAPFDETGPRCKHTIATAFAAELNIRRCWHCGEANDRDAMICASCKLAVTPF
jgi:hypothetical protein